MLDDCHYNRMHDQVCITFAFTVPVSIVLELV